MDQSVPSRIRHARSGRDFTTRITTFVAYFPSACKHRAHLGIHVCTTTIDPDLFFCNRFQPSSREQLDRRGLFGSHRAMRRGRDRGSAPRGKLSASGRPRREREVVPSRDRATPSAGADPRALADSPNPVHRPDNADIPSTTGLIAGPRCREGVEGPPGEASGAVNRRSEPEPEKCGTRRHAAEPGDGAKLDFVGQGARDRAPRTK